MKQISYLFVGALLLLSSCSILDIEPKSEWSTESVPTEKAHIEAILYGGYQALNSALLQGFVYYGDARADVYYANGASAVTQDKITRSHLEHEMTQTNWSPFYTVVKQANVNIHYIARMIDEGVIEEDEEIAEAWDILGQSYALRAYAYFWMTRIWGALPLMTDPIFSAAEEIKLTRSSIDEVFALIHDDLDRADQYLYHPSSKTFTKNPTTFNAHSAKMLRAQAYMWQHRFDEALPVLDALIEQGGYLLEDLYDPSMKLLDNGAARTEISRTGFSKMFNAEQVSGSSETIFELSFSTADGDSNTVFDSFWSGTSPTLVVREDFAAEFSKEDFRRYASMMQESVKKRRVAKFVMNFERGDARNVVLMRLADLLLLRAEARLMVAGDELTDAEKEAVAADLNQIIVRAMGPDYALLPGGGSKESYENYTKQDFIDRVKAERRKELAFEGQRWFDLIRWGDVNRALSAMKPAEHTSYVNETGGFTIEEGTSFENGALVWPIYLGEIRRSNGRIVQNEYYK